MEEDIWMYQSVFPSPWLPSLVVLAAFCVCDFLRTEYKQAALIQPSPVSRNLVAHRSKQNLTIAAFLPSKCTFCLMMSPFSSFDSVVFIATCPGLGEQRGPFSLPYLPSPQQ